MKLLGVILAALVAVMITPFTPWFQEALSRWQYVAPTCGDPRDLEILDIAALVAKGDATVEVSSESDLKSRDRMHAFDGRPGSGWVPVTESPRDDDEAAAAAAESSTDWMTVKFTSPQRIALVCVVNGNAGDWVSYMRADRVRTVEVRLGDGDGKEEAKQRTSLRTLPEQELQNRQNLAIPDPKRFGPKPSYKEVSLTLVNRYLGSQVDDPNTTAAVDVPTRLVMLAEVEVWVDKK
ncbi:hypothetical protein QE394_001771 [Arthrobacter sp. SORGH_AS 212]|uniref:hypothetical protein n=1 Tax=Pseudarthrobacter sp. SORGH_AS 212 TaxID=3041777 RepID=UPI0027826C07|nr:hypothetical protein [Arthrobacter sp. SORGH_AS_0212]